jgi:hypothetical protein
MRSSNAWLPVIAALEDLLGALLLEHPGMHSATGSQVVMGSAAILEAAEKLLG